MPSRNIPTSGVHQRGPVLQTSLAWPVPVLDEALPTVDGWIQSKRKLDNLGEGNEHLWRVYDKLYDLSTFASKHPGGAFWIEELQGTDITEAFEASHVNGPMVEKMLQTFYVRDTNKPRAVPFTFNEDGFYKTLKRRVAKILPSVKSRSTAVKMYLVQYGLLLASALCVYFAMQLESVALFFFPTAFLFALTIAACHNFFHQRDGWTMYIFDLSLASSAEWRVSHAISHHFYPNTVYDVEITALEPFIRFFPVSKSKLRVLLSPVLCHVFYMLLFPIQVIPRIYAVFAYKSPFRPEFLLAYTLYIPMYLCCGSPYDAAIYWLAFQAFTSYWFILLSVGAAHHHPNIWHDGDPYAKDKNPTLDWGLHQLLAVRDRNGFTDNILLTSTNFGDHALHHLFPTVDASRLPQLYPALIQTCREFGYEWEKENKETWPEMWIGQFKQMMRAPAGASDHSKAA